MTKSPSSSVPSATSDDNGGAFRPAIDLPTALEQFQLGDFDTRWEMVKLLPQFGSAAIAPLIDLLHDLDGEEDDWDLPWFIAQVLGTFQHPEAIATLAHLLHSTNRVDVAEMAATALARCGVSAIAALSDLLQIAHTRFLAVQALAQIPDSRVISPLLLVINDRSAEVRASALEALSHFYHPVITRCLVQGLHDPAASVRQSAIVGVSLQADLLETDPVELLAFLLADLNLAVSRQAALALGRLGTDAAAQALAPVLTDPANPIALQLDCVRALGWIQTATALQGLAAGLDTASEAIKLEIITVLGRLTGSTAKARATALLVNLLQTQPPWVQPGVTKAIAHSLGQLSDPQALDSLIHLLAAQDDSVRFHAIAALKRLDAAAVLQRFEHFYKDTNSSLRLREAIAIAQQEWSNPDAAC